MKTKAEILEYLIREELRLMRAPPRFTRPMREPMKSYVRFIHKIRIQGWIRELRAERGES